MVLYFNAFQNVIYSCDGKAEFSAPVFSVTLSEFINDDLVDKKHFFLLSMLKRSCALYLTMIPFFSEFFGHRIFNNNFKVFSVTFD